MSQQTKTDNHNADAKLELRRYFLRTHHVATGEPIRVLDCFQGGGVLWARLRSEFPVAAYWGVDLKEKKGRLKIDSARILEQPGWNQNVVDLDAYGSPWKHFQHVLENARHDVTVFLTVGMVKVGGGNYDRTTLDLLGINFKTDLPNSLGVKLGAHLLAFAVGAAAAHGFEVADLREAFPQRNARYLGARLKRAS